MTIELQFLGAAATVTGSQYLLTTDRARILIDCGMFQGSPNESIRNRIPFAYDPTTIDALLLTHAHLDHCGRLALLSKRGFRGEIIATVPMRELARLVMLDAANLQEEDVRARQRRVIGAAQFAAKRVRELMQPRGNRPEDVRARLIVGDGSK